MRPMKWQASGALASFALIALAAVSRADFVPPAEGPVPFRRDKLPVDVDTMTTLSREVLSLTAADMEKGPARLRAWAQMTALALALDPANRQARETLEQLQQGGRPESGENGRELDRALSRAWQVHAWLDSPEAGADAQALAACLADVLSVADPKNPKSEDHLRAGETGSWKGWVAPEDAFKSKNAKPDKTALETPADPDKEKGHGKGHDSTPTDPAAAGIVEPEVEVSMPLWVFNNHKGEPPADKDKDKGAEQPPADASRVLEILRIHMSATPAEKGQGLMFTFESKNATDLTAAADSEVSAFMARRHGSTGPVTAAISWDKTRAFVPERNGAVLSGAAALLADAALSGKPPGAMALAVVGKDGKLELPPHFWETLRSLAAQSPGGRIVMPTSAADYLAGLLVLDNAPFFMKHEILLAGTVEELCDMASSAPKPEYAESFTKWQEIYKAGAGKPLGTFVAHPATLVRLKELGTAMPQHASARLLALQGSGNRPRFLQRSLLALEIREAILPIDELQHVETNKLSSKRLDEIHAACRAKLDKIGNSGIIDIRDRDMHKEAMAAADSLRPLARMMDKQDKDNSPYTILSKQIALHKESWREYLEALKSLTEAAGDAAEFPIPKPLSGK